MVTARYGNLVVFIKAAELFLCLLLTGVLITSTNQENDAKINELLCWLLLLLRMSTAMVLEL